MLLLENWNVFLNFLFNYSSSLIAKSLLQDEQLCFIKLPSTFLYSRKQPQILHLSLWIASVKSLTRSDNKVAINLILSMNFILYNLRGFISSFTDFHNYFFYWDGKGIIPFTIFSNTLELAIKLICQFFHYEIKMEFP